MSTVTDEVVEPEEDQASVEVETEENIFQFEEDLVEDSVVLEENTLPIDDFNHLSLKMDDQVVNIHNFVSPLAPELTNGKSVSLQDFEILSVIGQGAYGQVFLVKKSKEEVDRFYAMKVLRKAAIIVHGKETEHTKNERSILEEISHPFIVKLYYAFQCPSRLYLILNYASGGELFSYLNKERMFSDDVARFYIAEIFLGIEHLHSLGIIYRDLKPENVMLSKDGHILLTDFGLSKVAIDAATVCGTIEFMAPEILSERNKYDLTVDYWSLGIMLYDMITGAPPFTGANRKKIMESVVNKKPKFPNYIVAVTRDFINKLLKKDPRVRLGRKSSLEIRNHLFFKTIDWPKLLRKEIDPPFVPEFVSPTDISHFDKEFTSIPIAQSLLREEANGLDPHPFHGFSFVAESLDT